LDLDAERHLGLDLVEGDQLVQRQRRREVADGPEGQRVLRVQLRQLVRLERHVGVGVPLERLGLLDREVEHHEFVDPLEPLGVLHDLLVVAVHQRLELDAQRDTAGVGDRLQLPERCLRDADHLVHGPLDRLEVLEGALKALPATLEIEHVGVLGQAHILLGALLQLVALRPRDDGDRGRVVVDDVGDVGRDLVVVAVEDDDVVAVREAPRRSRDPDVGDVDYGMTPRGLGRESINSSLMYSSMTSSVRISVYVYT
jgi:hypothetical protein